MRPIVIAAGGTGGHFFPAEALAAVLIARGHRVVLMTDARSGALKSAVFGDRETYVLPGSGIAGRGMLRGIKASFGLLAGSLRAYAILRRLRPAAVIGFGGYPSFAPVSAARALRRMPFIAVHEQNAVLGRANLFLAGFADLVALSVTETRRVPKKIRTQVTGNPVRPAIAALHGVAYAPPRDAINLLVLGGSLGARVFSDIVPACIAALPQDLSARLTVVQQCRAEDIARVQDAYQKAGINAELAPFFTDVAARLAQAHLVIARAGASTVAELAVAGRPSLLVPLPGAIDEHQLHNAASLDGAVVCPQTDFTVANITAALATFLDTPEWLQERAARAAACAHPDAAAELADVIEHNIAPVSVAA